MDVHVKVEEQHDTDPETAPATAAETRTHCHVKDVSHVKDYNASQDVVIEDAPEITSVQPSLSILEQLPTEILQHIFSYLLVGSNIRNKVSSLRKGPHYNFHTAIMQTNRNIGRLARDHLLSYNFFITVIMISFPPEAYNFWRSMPVPVVSRNDVGHRISSMRLRVGWDPTSEDLEEDFDPSMVDCDDGECEGCPSVLHLLLLHQDLDALCKVIQLHNHTLPSGQILLSADGKKHWHVPDIETGCLRFHAHIDPRPAQRRRYDSPETMRERFFKPFRQVCSFMHDYRFTSVRDGFGEIPNFKLLDVVSKPKNPVPYGCEVFEDEEWYDEEDVDCFNEHDEELEMHCFQRCHSVDATGWNLVMLLRDIKKTLDKDLHRFNDRRAQNRCTFGRKRLITGYRELSHVAQNNSLVWTGASRVPDPEFINFSLDNSAALRSWQLALAVITLDISIILTRLYLSDGEEHRAWHCCRDLTMTMTQANFDRFGQFSKLAARATHYAAVGQSHHMMEMDVMDESTTLIDLQLAAALDPSNKLIRRDIKSCEGITPLTEGPLKFCKSAIWRYPLECATKTGIDVPHITHPLKGTPELMSDEVYQDFNKGHTLLHAGLRPEIEGGDSDSEGDNEGNIEGDIEGDSDGEDEAEAAVYLADAGANGQEHVQDRANEMELDPSVPQDVSNAAGQTTATEPSGPLNAPAAETHDEDENDWSDVDDEEDEDEFWFDLDTELRKDGGVERGQRSLNEYFDSVMSDAVESGMWQDGASPDGIL